jgi:radical SAM superfamily enzyme YgiQ (UPF0313 family)
MGFLSRAGFSASSIDVSVEGFDAERAARARFVGISVPMHTALRLGVSVAREVRRVNAECHICFYGLYASLNSDYLLEKVADSVIGGEYEEALLALIKAVDRGLETEITGVSSKASRSLPRLSRLDFPAPDRATLPRLDRYAQLDFKGEQRLAGYVEASRGCLHRCTHCPIPPVYEGRFFVIPKDIIAEEIRSLVRDGARHVTFGDPDFLNGPQHALRIARALHEEFPDLTFDFTAKVEHIIKHRRVFPELARLGCIFVVSAVESLSDSVLDHLEKGHTGTDVNEALKDVNEALNILSDSGIALRPTFVAFTPWTTIDDYIAVLEFVESRGLIDHVDPVQFAIRLLVPPGSLLLGRADTSRWIGRLNQESFTYEWAHPDRRMDELHRKITRLVEQAATNNRDAAETFYRIRELATKARGDVEARRATHNISPLRLRPPRLTEAWFC